MTQTPQEESVRQDGRDTGPDTKDLRDGARARPSGDRDTRVDRCGKVSGMTVLGEAHLSADGGPLRWAKRLRTLGLVAVAAMLAGLPVGAGTSPAQAAPPAIIRVSPDGNHVQWFRQRRRL